MYKLTVKKHVFDHVVYTYKEIYKLYFQIKTQRLISDNQSRKRKRELYNPALKCVHLAILDVNGAEFWKQIPSNEPYRIILGDLRDKLYHTRERSRQLLANGVSDVPKDTTFTSVEQV